MGETGMRARRSMTTRRRRRKPENRLLRLRAVSRRARSPTACVRHFNSVAHVYDFMNTLLSFGIHHAWKRAVGAHAESRARGPGPGRLRRHRGPGDPGGPAGRGRAAGWSSTTSTAP
ncbi:MAG: class I SAM-dependent methyltransferase [Desulfobacterales bacterium]|nr:class I SAM-dependent methyltransferase [Desulfobacterales bacterium]